MKFITAQTATTIEFSTGAGRKINLPTGTRVEAKVEDCAKMSACALVRTLDDPRTLTYMDTLDLAPIA